MLLEHNRYKVSEIISQPIAVCLGIFVCFFVVGFGFFNGSVKTAWLCISFALVAANIFNTIERKELWYN